MKMRKEVNDENTRALSEQLRHCERQREVEKQMLEDEREEFRKKMKEEERVAKEADRVRSPLHFIY